MTTETKKTTYYKLLVAGFILLLLIGGGILAIYLGKAHKIEAESVQKDQKNNYLNQDEFILKFICLICHYVIKKTIEYVVLLKKN